MSLTRAIAHNTALQLIGKVISTVLGLMAVAIMTRTLGTEQFGWYATATGLLQFVGIFSDFGFTVTTSNLLAEPQFNKQEVLNTTFTWRLLTALFFYGLTPFIVFYFPYPPAVKLAVVITAVSFLATTLSSVFIAYYRTELSMMVASVSEVVGRAALVIGIAAVAVGHNTFLPMMVVIAVTSVISLVYLWIKSGGVRLRLHGDISRVMFHKMWPTALAVIFNAFYWQGDRVLLPLYVSQASVGLYGAAYRVLEVVIQIAAMIMGLIMPLITYAWSRNLRQEFTERYQLGFDMLALLLLPMLAGTIVLATPIMYLVAGKEFAHAGSILQGLSVAIFGICFGMVFGHIMLAIDHQKKSLWIFASDAVFSVVGYFLFIPHYGIPGAIGVTIFSELYAGAGLFLLAGFYSGVWPKLQTFGKIMLASILMGAIIWYFQPLPVFLSILLGIVIYGLFIILFRVISATTLREILTFTRVAQAE